MRRLDEAIDALASRIEYGALRAGTDPAGFLRAVCEEMDRLKTIARAAEDVVRTREAARTATTGAPIAAYNDAVRRLSTLLTESSDG